MTDNKTHNNGQANYSHELTILMSVYGHKRAYIYTGCFKIKYTI